MIKDLSDNHLFNNYPCEAEDAKIESLRQQLDGWIAANSPNGWIDNLRLQLASQGEALAAALAAIKVKDEAINWAFDYDGDVFGINHNDATDALAIKPDDSALKAWLGEPVFIRRDQLLKVRVAPFLCRIDPIQHDAGWIPLYAPKGMSK